MIALIGAALVIGWIILPLIGGAGKAKIDSVTAQRERLQAAYAQTLRNIRDLDEDHATGKIVTETYQIEREAWVQRGVALLKALDTLENDGAVSETAADDAIEAAIAAYRQKADVKAHD